MLSGSQNPNVPEGIPKNTKNEEFGGDRRKMIGGGRLALHQIFPCAIFFGMP
ncbi:hypothetical protein L873DRAFT_103866 [Choiromyces venosus 120613-1]|uniref:Uncharacterized protein n=1 Tax=Choiromyces venosus 120613-1 TaxID=1336337 RepID=A0A3N4JZR6_9PEZI|nr:hypothetical protein L873DRAFT_103866 [Choiromyces venosus 120613-1]